MTCHDREGFIMALRVLLLHQFSKCLRKQACVPVECVLPTHWPYRIVSRRGVSAWGVPGDLSHHTFDVTCMLSPYQLRASNNAAAYILLVGHGTCKTCWNTSPVDRQPPLTRMHSSRMCTACSSSCPWGASTRHPLGADTPWSRAVKI